MTCDQATGLLLELIENTLRPSERQALDAHLDTCELCPKLLVSYRQTVTLCGKALTRAAPPEFGERLMTFLRAETASSRR